MWCWEVQPDSVNWGEWDGRGGGQAWGWSFPTCLWVNRKASTPRPPPLLSHSPAFTLWLPSSNHSANNCNVNISTVRMLSGCECGEGFRETKTSSCSLPASTSGCVQPVKRERDKRRTWRWRQRQRDRQESICCFQLRPFPAKHSLISSQECTAYSRSVFLHEHIMWIADAVPTCNSKFRSKCFLKSNK